MEVALDPSVRTSDGTLRGRATRGLCVFRGIPFAAPPIGPLRFRAPARPSSWKGVRQATQFGPAAPQSLGLLRPLLGLRAGAVDEDCLRLNVWTPGLDGRRRPVLVWIHGGGFIIGAGSQALYDGAVLARRGDVVVVTVNYRLGALGFLRLEDVSGGRIRGTGNEGLLDQVAALEWVRDEIAAFGGDPDNVTVFGESAGAISAACLLAMPRARGLFGRAILQSGAPNFVAAAAAATGVADELLRELGIPARRVDAVQGIPTRRLLDAQRQLFFTLDPRWRRLAPVVTAVRALRRVLASRPAGQPRLPSPLLWPLTVPARVCELMTAVPRWRPQGLPLQPVVDGDVVPDDPFRAIEAGASRGVAVLIGTNQDEARLFRLLDREARTLDEGALVARCERTIPGRDERGTSHGRRAIDVYRRARAARGAAVDPPALWFAIETDRMMRDPAMRLAGIQARHQPRTFAYLFTWPSPLGGGSLGACHGLELPFVFGTFRHPLIRWFAGAGPAPSRLAKQIQDAWLAFARSGDPSHPGIGDWPAYDRARRRTMLLGRECHVEDAPLEQERAFWDTTTRYMPVAPVPDRFG